MRIFQQERATSNLMSSSPVPAEAESPADTQKPAATSAEPYIPQVQLEISRGRARCKMRKVNSPVFLIGADAECDLVLGDPTCAGVHLYLFVREDGVFLRAIARTPEVRVDGALFRAGEIYDGNRIAMGGYEFCVHVSESHPGSRKTPDTETDGRYIPFYGSHEDPQGVQAVRRLLRDIRMDITAERLSVYSGPQLGASNLPAYLGDRNSA